MVLGFRALYDRWSFGSQGGDVVCLLNSEHGQY